jgi:hypothetical protein
MSWVLRASRRAKAFGVPWRVLNGMSRMPSAPPTAAPKAAEVARRRFT